MRLVFLALILSCLSVSAFAQTSAAPDTTTGKPYYILLKDGSHIYGRIVRQDSVMYTVKTRSGQLTYVEKELYQSIAAFAPVPADSTVYYTNPNASTPPGQQTVSPNQYVVTLTDGTILNGQVLSQDTARLVLKTTNIGTVYVPAEKVARMERAALRSGRTARPSIHPAGGYANLFPQYMHFTPTAFQAERGHTYYRNNCIYFNQIDAGVTDNWSLGAGLITPFFPLLAGWVSTKLSAPIGPRARIGIQGQVFFGGFTFLDRDFFSASYVQGVLSLGDSQNNVTFGLGRSFDRGSTGSILTVGIVRKVKPLLSFISENQLILNQGSSSVGRLSGGLRFDRARHSFDLSANLIFGLYNGSYRSGTSFILTPLGSYQLRLGR